MKIVVIGTGYVGLVTSAVFADFGNKVWALDVDKDKIKRLKKGKVPFYEPNLEKIIKKNLKNGRICFSASYQETIPQAEIIFICVGTPAKKNGDYDLSYIFSAAESLAPYLKKEAVVCIKSTVPPSTSEKIKKIIKKKTKINFYLASCPEFLREGSALEDARHPSRIVIGVDRKKAKERLLKLHQSIKAPRLVCDIKSAQMIKYAANAFLATKISFINSIARLTDVVGADIKKVSLGLGLDPRIGGQFLEAGLGYGGSCFPKDTWALIAYAQRLGYNFKFLREVDRVNRGQIGYFVKKIIRLCGGKIKNKNLTILGLAFKPNTDDLREARSVELIRELKKKGAKINAYDPAAMIKARKIITGVSFFKDPYLALKGSEALILVTEWPEFKRLDFRKIGQLMRRKVIIDARNFFSPTKMKNLGFIYEGIGRT